MLVLMLVTVLLLARRAVHMAVRVVVTTGRLLVLVLVLACMGQAVRVAVLVFTSRGGRLLVGLVVSVPVCVAMAVLAGRSSTFLVLVSAAGIGVRVATVVAAAAAVLVTMTMTVLVHMVVLRRFNVDHHIGLLDASQLQVTTVKQLVESLCWGMRDQCGLSVSVKISC
jgi:hypothetical protein